MVITARLGWWQLDRAAQKTQLQAQIQAQGARPALSAIAPSEAAGQIHRRAILRGQWLDPHSVYLDNRQMQGKPGFFVLTPLQLDSGGVIVVQRGWIPRHMQDRTQLAPVQTPTGVVEVAGRIAPSPSKLLDLNEGAKGRIRQNLELAAFAAETGLPLLPVTLVQDDAPSDGLLRDWAVPSLGVGKHHGYAFQWFALSALVFFLYVWFEFIQPRRRAKQTHADV